MADLPETLQAHKEGCVEIAANMVSLNKHIISFDNEGADLVMFNLEVIKKSAPYEAEEGCLCTCTTV